MSLNKQEQLAYDTIWKKALTNGIPHEVGCRYEGTSVPVNVCLCEKKWWFKQVFFYNETTKNTKVVKLKHNKGVK